MDKTKWKKTLTIEQVDYILNDYFEGHCNYDENTDSIPNKCLWGE